MVTLEGYGKRDLTYLKNNSERCNSRIVLSRVLVTSRRGLDW
jgi:hypothetical protein